MRRLVPGGQVNLVVIVAVAALILAGAAGLVIRGGSAREHEGKPDKHLVRRGSFDITVPVSGELAALEQIEIRSRLDKQATVAEIIEEGSRVNAGDVLIRFNDEEVRNNIKDAVDAVNLAQAEAESAASELDIKIKEQESEIAKAELAVQLAGLALKAWQEGEDVAKRQELALALETAEKEYARLMARFEESERLLEQKFISLDEYKQDEIALIQARAKLKEAELDITVYQQYECVQTRAQKESDLEQAIAELDRTKQRFEAQVHQANTELDSRKYQLSSKQERLRHFQQQLEYSTVIAPTPGLVVYHSSLESGRWGNSSDPPQVGSQFWPNQVVMVLPNTSRMVAAVKVSEALSGLIQPGQPATVVSDAVPDMILDGVVRSIGVLAQSGGWRDPNRRDYTVRIELLDGSDLGLKPSMRCKADINVGRVNGALHVPVQAVFRSGPLSYVYVPDRSGYSQRKVSVGRSSELYIEVTEGVAEGETVLLREPEPYEIVSRLPMPKREEDEGRFQMPPEMFATGESPQASSDKASTDDQKGEASNEEVKSSEETAPVGDRSHY